LEENHGTIETVREAYEKAVTNIPPFSEKKYWRRYIFVWINYAVYEEYTAKDCDRAKEIYKKALEIIPHQKFTFSKLWILYAHFYIRMKNLEQARKVFGMSIAICPREKIFKAYIELELQLGNVEKCRQIYEKFISIQPDNSSAWVKYAELEKSLDEYERCIAIFQAAITQPLDMPEIVWKAYINVEISYKKFDNVRNLYEILLEKTRHVKVWLSYSKFEQEVIDFEKCRDVFDRAYKYFKESNSKEERLMILENWIKTEENNLVNFLKNNLVSINYENEEDEYENAFDDNAENNNFNRSSKYNSVLNDEMIEEKIKNFDFDYHINKTQEVLKMLLQRRPEKIKKRRRILTGISKIKEMNEYNKSVEENIANDEEGWEEYYDYIFPDDEDNKKNFKILSHAMKWHKEAKGNN